MRCPNCGWMNASGQTKCEKCDTAIQGGVSSAVPDKNSGKSAAGSGSGMVMATAMGRPANAPAWDEHVNPVQPPPTPPPSARPTEKKGGDGAKKDMLTCPSCKYPNTSSANFCVACGAALTEAGIKVPGNSTIPATNETPKQSADAIDTGRKKKESDPAPPNSPSVARPASPNFNATVNPWSQRKKQSFNLRPLPREGEQLNVQLPFEGETVELNRANLEPSNTSITSKMQAHIIFRDGVWYISNKSAQQTTFIRVDGEVPLKKGDILLLGDRLFEFDC